MLDQYISQSVVRNFEKYCQKCTLHDYILVPSIKKLLSSNLSGKRCIDMGCGYGNSTKWLADLDPAELIGLDQSQTMLDLAKENCSAHPAYGRIKFLCQDCSNPIGDGKSKFDVVFSAYLLNHAGSRDTLDRMVKSMYEATTKGGICLGLMPSPFLRPEQFSLLYKYGLDKLATKNDDKLDVKVRFYDGDVRDGKFLTEVVDYQYEPEIYENVFTSNGFKNFEWIIPRLDDKHKHADNDEFLKEYLDINPFILFRAIKE